MIRRIGLFSAGAWAQNIVDRFRDAASSGSSPSASGDFYLDLLPCDIPPYFLCRGNCRRINVPGATAKFQVLKHFAPMSFYTYIIIFVSVVSVSKFLSW